MILDDITTGWHHAPAITLLRDRRVRHAPKRSRDLNAAYGIIINAVLGAGIIGWSFAIGYYLLVMR